MKRRLFLAATLATLFSPATLAAPAKKADPAKKTRNATSKKSKKNARVSTKKPAARKSAPLPVAEPQTSACHSVLDNAPPGSSATRLPPVQAPELPDEWHLWEIVFTLQRPAARGEQRLWLPLPMRQDTRWQRNLGARWQYNGETGALVRLPDDALEAFYGEWPEGLAPRLVLTARVAAANRRFDVSRRSVPPEREDLVRKFLAASRQIPNTGRIYSLARAIVGRVVDPVAQARLLYQWVSNHADYNPDLPGYGQGDVNALIATLPEPVPPDWRYAGASADITGFFVALCRALGIPARRVFGIRVGASQTLESLGLSGTDATRAFHCRAECYVPGYSWIGVDPASVCQASVTENLKADDAKRLALQKLLFGFWEMNWVAFNTSEDIRLPEGDAELPFLALPRLVNPEGELDGSAPNAFGYRIESRPR
ncbi:MAG: transglutaminase-like domain-containing protein [Zoogloeaceae bacterium]|jgi:transglutaminase-like putative cysteine protease|nr:transglutaminase-like domain-containing protein [Zoogloeaceae bacterium]